MALSFLGVGALPMNFHAQTIDWYIPVDALLCPCLTGFSCLPTSLTVIDNLCLIILTSPVVTFPFFRPRLGLPPLHSAVVSAASVVASSASSASFAWTFLVYRCWIDIKLITTATM